MDNIFKNYQDVKAYETSFFLISLYFRKSHDGKTPNYTNDRNPPTKKIATLSPTVSAIDNHPERKMSSKVTNGESHSIVKPKFSFGLNTSDSVSGTDKDLFAWNFSFYPTFGTKYPYSETLAVDDTTEEEFTTEQIDIEELEKQLLDVLDKLAEKQSNE